MRLEPELRMDVAGACTFARLPSSPRRLMGAHPAAHRGGRGSPGKRRWRLATASGRIEGGTNRGELAADEYVLASGVWSSELARDLGLRLPMEAGKGYTLTLDAPPHAASLRHSFRARVAMTPMGSALRFGGTMELAGVDTEVDLARVRGIAESVPRYLPDFPAQTFRSVRAWCGLRPCSPDGLPYIGRWPEPANLIAATGHAMMGVSLGPVSGKLVAEILSDEQPTIALDLVRPDRFASPKEKTHRVATESGASISTLSDR
jgi:D-amino-acid dehydrogenase